MVQHGSRKRQASGNAVFFRRSRLTLAPPTYREHKLWARSQNRNLSTNLLHCWRRVWKIFDQTSPVKNRVENFRRKIRGDIIHGKSLKTHKERQNTNDDSEDTQFYDTVSQNPDLENPLFCTNEPPNLSQLFVDNNDVFDYSRL